VETLKHAIDFKDTISERGLAFIRENRNLIARFFLTALFFGLGIWFLKHERAELAEVKSTIIASQWTWLLLGIAVTGIYCALQGLMYVAAFNSIQCKWQRPVNLFLA
jgi:phosphatidylglycerol lysyltransferase